MNRLQASRLNLTFNAPFSGISRSSARSAFFSPGPQRLLRVAVPNVNGGGVTNAAVLNHMSAFGCSTSGDRPGTTLARIGLTFKSDPAFAVSPKTLTVNGNPLCN